MTDLEPTAGPSMEDVARTASARRELAAMHKILEALAPLAEDDRMRVLASAAIMAGVVSMQAVRSLLSELGGR